MRILALADMDVTHWPGGTGEADVVVSCGDVADAVLLEAGEAYRCARLLAVKGNHDPAGPFTPPIVDLHLRLERHLGLVFGGLNGCWRYKPRGHFLYDQDEVHRLLSGFPAVDVFVAHNAPRGIHDRDDGVHVGFDALDAYIRRVGPRLLLHGHQHVNQESAAADTKVVGVWGHRLLEV